MKIYSAQNELLAIKALCSPKPEVSSLVLASVDADHFHTEEAVEAYDRIMQVIGAKGQAPVFEALCEDPKVSEETRSVLQQVTSRVRSKRQLGELLDNLHQYRKTRAIYRLAKGIMAKMEQKSIDVEKLVTVIQDRAAKLSINKSMDNTIFHIGRDNNTMELVRQLIYDEDDSHVIPTGLKTWDDVNGGFLRGSVVLIAATTGAGKCASSETNVTLSTLIFSVEGSDNILEAEPDDPVFLHSDTKAAQLIRAGSVQVGDDLILEPRKINDLLTCLGDGTQELDDYFDIGRWEA